MAVCVGYQNIYYPRVSTYSTLKLQIILAAVLLALLGGKVWVKLSCTDLGYELARERDRTMRLDMERRELELQRSVIMRPDLLAKRAQSTLGLRMANNNQVFILK